MSMQTMSMQRKTAAALLACLATLLLSAAQASAAAPAWKLVAVQLPTHVAPDGEGTLMLVATNVGAKQTEGTATITDTLPEGLVPGVALAIDQDSSAGAADCELAGPGGRELTCTAEGPVWPGRQWEVRVHYEVEAGAPEGVLADEATLTGGGADPANVDSSVTVDSTPASFGFLGPDAGGPAVTAGDEDGDALALAGAHPYQQTVGFGFPTEEPNDVVINAGHPRDILVELPRGLAINPAATPTLCTEAELTTLDEPGCPRSSQLGTITVTTFLAGSYQAAMSPLNNMVPPPGVPAMVAFDAAGVGIFVHIAGDLRSDGDYGITTVSPDSLALTLHPVFGARADLWGDPSSPVHGKVRGDCVVADNDKKEGPCETEARESALISLPGECTGEPSKTGFAANSWESPGVFERASAQSAELGGTPVALEDCEALDFESSIEVRPTTAAADSPAGLDFNLHQPQDTKLGEEGKGRATAALKDATFELPEGLVVNPSAANGQRACSPSQIGLATPVGQAAPVNFSKAPASCPDAAKLGTVTVSSPLLAQTGEGGTKVVYDDEGNPVARPLQGSVYLAEPFQNPFGSLLAIYLDVEDAQTGIVAKFAAKVSADPDTGRLTSTLTESPELPLEDVRVHFFAGDRAALRTPSACGSYGTHSTLVPWSAPETPAASPNDAFVISTGAGGGPCPSSPGAVPATAQMSAGTEAPLAATYSPFSLRVSRPDGSQSISAFEATLPRGLTAKLAGIPYCPEGAIARAIARSQPNEGALERDDPSCPAASLLGTIDAAAGAGPDPVHASGRLYLAGPYKSAPLSAVAVVPAIAGPFDLGTVTVRTALRVDPESAEVRVVSDPLPQSLQGIPLDLRAATVRVDRPSFILNPSSCEEKRIDLAATTVFSHSISLASRFQAGGCAQLAFKPKLGLRLKGRTRRAGHPALRAVLRFGKDSRTNIARASVALPHSEFLDQAHIRTVCTRVQFAANQCPTGSIYGRVRAFSPLLDDPLEGPIYLRSSSHPLPDLVAALKGQVEVNLVGRIDSIRGGIRTTFESVPDAPVSKAIFWMRGGRRGLLENSTNLCARPHYASISMLAQNGRRSQFMAPLQNDCPKHKRRGGHGRR